MKNVSSSTSLRALALSIALASFALPNDLSGGTISSDEIIIYRSTESSRHVEYFQGYERQEFDEDLGEFVTTQYPGGKHRYSLREQCYVILNLTSGEYRKVRFRTGYLRDRDGRRIRFRELEWQDRDSTPMALFQTGPDDRRNYMILSLLGSGRGLNFGYDDRDDVNTFVHAETLEGRVRVQRIRTDQGVMECLAPSALRGKTGSEQHSTDGGPSDTRRYTSQGNRTLRIDKRLIRAAKDKGSTSLADFQAVVVEFLRSRGYSEGASGA